MDVAHHISRQFDEELEEVRNMVLAMGGLVETHVADALRSLIEADGALAERVAASDSKVDALELAIDERCTRILVRRQPAAGDLRLIVTLSKTITDLERIGDEAEKIARLAGELLGSDRPRGQFNEIRHLGEHVLRSLRDALDAYARLDVKAALRVVRDDRLVDAEYNSTMRQLMTFMMQDPSSIQRAMDVLWCARAMERIGDHAKNICEYVVYMVLGRDIRHGKVEQVDEVLTDGAGP
jgi:phosphate transport system protein